MKWPSCVVSIHGNYFMTILSMHLKCQWYRDSYHMRATSEKTCMRFNGLFTKDKVLGLAFPRKDSSMFTQTLFRLDEQNCRQLYQSQIATILFDPGILLKELTWFTKKGCGHGETNSWNIWHDVSDLYYAKWENNTKRYVFVFLVKENLIFFDTLICENIGVCYNNTTIHNIV